MKANIGIRAVCAALAIAVLCAACGGPAPSAADGALSTLARPQGARAQALYHGPWAVAEPDAVRAAASGPWQLEAGGSVEIPLDVPADGDYALLLRYRTRKDVTLRSVMRAELAGQECLTQLFSLWRDETKEYGLDRAGNHLMPSQMTENEPVDDYVVDQALISRAPFVYQLKAGAQTLTLSSEDVPLEIERVQLIAAGDAPSYAQYSAQYAQCAPGTDEIVIEAENYSVKSDSSIRAAAVRSAALSPYDYRYRLLNVLDEASLASVGAKVQYAFSVDTPGLYQLTFHYRQNYKEDIPAYQNVRIDGRTLFAEMNSVSFPYTGVSYANMTLSADGAPAQIYLEAGEHTLLLEADGTPVSDAADRLTRAMDRLSEIGLEIKKLSGTQANANRTWDVESYLPGVLDELKAIRGELQDVYTQLGALQQKENPAGALSVKHAVNNLNKILKEPDKIPGKLSLLSEGSGSATKLLADQIDKLKDQGVTLDAIYVQSAPVTRPANAGFLTGLADGTRRFFNKLFSEGDEALYADEVLQVWVNRPLHHIAAMQTLADSGFTAQTGIPVQISMMPSEQRIILSNATDMAPDVIMGLSTNTPFDLGLRGAVIDLSQMPGFAQTMSEYNPDTLTPYILEDRVYGVTERQDFYITIYRTDIFEKLGLEVPETWDDVRDMMPVLQRNSMNFYMQLSGYSGTKPLYSTAPFLMQAGGGIYGEGDATVTGVNSAASLKGFETLTDLYRLYSVQPTVASFYNSFRHGQIPIGIGSFSDYLGIRSAAPEIAGKWAVAPAPGFRDENGVIHNGTTGASSACAIMSGSDQQQDGWRFLQWWLSADVQVAYGNLLQTVYGPTNLWNSANLKAFAQLNFPEADKAVILKQWNSLCEINRHPALYVVERELSNAWQDVVERNDSARIALDNAALKIDREFRRKLTEFGYLDAQGNLLRPFGYTPIETILKGAGQ